MALADRIKAARDQSPFTQARAAAQLGVSTASIAAYEQGTRDVPDSVLESMATLYGVPAPVLRYGDEVLRLAALTEVERRVRRAAAALLGVADTLRQSDEELEEAMIESTRLEAEPVRIVPTGNELPHPDTNAAGLRTAPPQAPGANRGPSGHTKSAR